MDFEEFLPDNVNIDEKVEKKDSKNTEKIGREQVYDVITSRKPDWQTIIYELIASEQLDPWDIDLVVLTKRYFEKLSEFEEHDFYISSKVLLAAALLLRIKSEFLLNRHIKSIDDILFGKKENSAYKIERIEIDEDELPLLVPKTPMPRLRRVTLQELMGALNKAINTESRRIKKEVAVKRAKLLSEVDFPKFQRVDLKDRIRRFYARILTSLKKTKEAEKHLNKVCYTNLAGKGREEKLSFFLPLLHLSNTKKLWLEQEKHLDEIWVYLYDYFDKNRDKFAEDLREIEEEIKEMDDSSESFENLDQEILNNQKITDEEEKEHIREEIIHEIEKEEKEIEREEKIEEASGFSDSEE
jgi:segregation and condensation protein A